MNTSQVVINIAKATVGRVYRVSSDTGRMGLNDDEEEERNFSNTKTLK